MKDNFRLALAKTLEFEGGYSNHPKDPGGATNHGITQRVYDAWRRLREQPLRSVKAITAEEVAAIYAGQYWAPIRGDVLPAGVDAAVFDAGVMSGPVRAAKWLQGALRVTQDGHIGAVTLDAARKADRASLASTVCDRRLAFCHSLKTWPTFGKGWARRIRELKTFAGELAG